MEKNILTILYVLFGVVFHSQPHINRTCEYTNLQKTSKSRQVLSVALVSISIVVFCGIILYHVWDHLLESRFATDNGLQC